jgi:hypothetical protein
LLDISILFGHRHFVLLMLPCIGLHFSFYFLLIVGIPFSPSAVLKINKQELLALTGCADMDSAAALCFSNVCVQYGPKSEPSRVGVAVRRDKNRPEQVQTRLLHKVHNWQPPLQSSRGDTHALSSFCDERRESSYLPAAFRVHKCTETSFGSF